MEREMMKKSSSRPMFITLTSFLLQTWLIAAAKGQDYNPGPSPTPNLDYSPSDSPSYAPSFAPTPATDPYISGDPPAPSSEEFAPEYPDYYESPPAPPESTNTTGIPPPSPPSPYNDYSQSPGSPMSDEYATPPGGGGGGGGGANITNIQVFGITVGVTFALAFGSCVLCIVKKRNENIRRSRYNWVGDSELL